VSAAKIADNTAQICHEDHILMPGILHCRDAGG